MYSHTIELCDGLMCVMDADGNGYDCHELRSLRDAKRQLRRWQNEYTFDYAAALRELSEFFADEPKAPTNSSHHDYAEEAEAAQRAEAWPQAAALWRRAADVLRASAPHDTETFERHAKYQAAAATCDRRADADAALERIARDVLRIPTLRQRHSDRLDFHDLGVGRLRLALRTAYEAGRASQH